MDLEFIIAGIGGQGVLFLTKLLSLVADESNLPFIGSEVHGMSQRGGSVVSHLRIGNFRSPLVREGRAHILFALEEKEAYGNIHFLRPSGKLYVNTSCDTFPDNSLKDILDENNINIIRVDANSIAGTLRSFNSANLVILGLFIGMEANIFTVESAEKAIRRTGKEQFFNKNIEAFQKGLEIAEKMRGAFSCWK